ncbi:MAG: hypothetical protein NVS3B26_24430 [Mycobacteriales bacterium]
MTAYALAVQTRRALRHVWGSSRRLLLAEPARLAAKGLVESLDPEPGSRAGQRWQATPAGRQVLREWLQQPVAPTAINSELLLRLTFADQSDLQTLRSRVLQRQTDLAAEIDECLLMLDDYLDTGGPFPARLHITTAAAQFIAETKLAELTFLRWLHADLALWPDTTTPDPNRHTVVLRELRMRVLAAVNAVD